MYGNNDTLRILVVEDDEDDFMLINEYLKKLRAWKCEVKWIYRYDEAIEELCRHHYTLCFSDYRLGAKNGIDLIRDVQARTCNTPVILLTGRGNYEIDIEATKAGAFDYLIKADLDVDKLERTIRYTLERIQNLQRLRESERKYRSIFEKSKDIVFLAAADTTVFNINPAVAEILEMSVEDIIGKKLLDFIPNPAQRAHFVETMEKETEIENYEIEMLSEKRTLRTCLVSASYQLESNEEKYIQGIIHDITNLKKAEAATIQAEKLAASGRFIRTLAHEVRNPLNNINLSVENLLEQSGGEDDKLYLEIIQRNGKRINDLITELLQSSRPSDMDLQPVSLQEVVRQVIDSVADRAMLRNITIRYESNEQAATMKADASKLVMAILNIVINAIEAVKDGTGVIDISLQSRSKHVLLQISDNGIGISPENKSRLFEPYFTSKRNGMGLGLATTLTILRAHNADIEVDSELDHGTTFRLVFQLN
ncbi:hybrid sensor histidine kinase/response regulator [Sediminibacterium soli]|uniref:hybrid sensor histidine kinase/response regulator n=1 Tax=Sediminibacterium soli TaxID=2698829 RepID=UPI00137AC0B2|nr:ATP-binding protein [Sediminibacterium soli]NCI45889.1 response regulator [Sediminibacterium soli]